MSSRIELALPNENIHQMEDENHEYIFYPA